MTEPSARFDEAVARPDLLGDPYPLFRALRESAPVHWSSPMGVWLISRYDDVLTALRDDGQRFSLVGTVAARIAALAPADQAALSPLREHYSSGLMHSDPPEHTRIRALISKAFTPRTIEGLRARIGRIVDDLLVVLAAREQVDLVADFAFPLPAIVVSEVLGLSPDDRLRFKAWSDDIARFIGSGTASAGDAYKAQESLLEAREHLAMIADERRSHPRDDLISRLVRASESEALTVGELLSTCVTFMVGGHETTTSLISSAVLLLDRHPDQRRAFLDDPGIVQGVIEETLRYEPPTQRSVRRLASDLVLDGQSLSKGQTAFLLLAAANRDPTVFADPDRFDVRRQPNRHLSFGMGAHFCIGAPLARLEAEIALTSLYGHFPSLTVMAGEPRWIDNFNFRQLRSLPITLRNGGPGPISAGTEG